MSTLRVVQRHSRLIWAVVAVVLVPFVIWLARDQGHGWIALAFGLMPDIGLLYGMSPSLAKGQLHPRAVPLYNILHSVGGPLVTILAGLSGPAPEWLLIAGLAWLAHVAVDRALGYGLRDKNGYVRDTGHPTMGTGQ